MASAWTQAGSGTGNFVPTYTVSAVIAANHKAVVVLWSDQDLDYFTITDSAGNTWQTDVDHVANNSQHINVAVCSAEIVTAITSITVHHWTDAAHTTVDSNGKSSSIVYDVTGLASSAWFDASGTEPGAVYGATTSVGLTSVTADTALLAAYVTTTGVTGTADTGYTELADVDGIASRHVYVQTKDIAAAGAQTAVVTWTVAENVNGLIVAYKLVAAGGGGSAPTNTTAPVVTTSGAVASSTPGAWTGSPSGYTYQWQRDNSGGGTYADIAGQTASTKTVVSADTGCQVRCRVTATNGIGSTSANSNSFGSFFRSGTAPAILCGNGVLSVTLYVPPPPPPPPPPTPGPPPVVVQRVEKIYGPREPAPHFALPFQMRDIGNKIKADTYLQDTVDEVTQCVLVCLLFPLGFRLEKPEFGVRDQAFNLGGIDMEEIEAAIYTWEPRVVGFMQRDPSLLSQMIDQVRITIYGGNTSQSGVPSG